MPHIVLTVDDVVVYDNQASTGGSKNTSKNESKNESQEVQEGGKKKGKGTRKLSGYMKFCQTARKELLAEKPELKSDIPGIGRALGAKWRSLSDAEKAKY